jgi:hypothetical protein
MISGNRVRGENNRILIKTMAQEKGEMRMKESRYSIPGAAAIAFACLFVFAISCGAPVFGDSRSDRSCLAQDTAERKVLLILPMILEGDFKPLKREEMQGILEKDMEAAYPSLDVVFPASDDERLKGITIAETMPIRTLMKLADSYKASFIIWGTFTYKETQKTIQVGAGDIRYLLIVEGLAQIKVYDSKANDTIIDQTMVQSNNDTTRALEDTETFRGVEERLARQCVSDLALNLLKSIKSRLAPAEEKQ